MLYTVGIYRGYPVYTVDNKITFAPTVYKVYAPTVYESVTHGI